jgi:cytochrome c551/c552
VKVLLGVVGKVKVTVDGKDLTAADVKYDGNPTMQPSVPDAAVAEQQKQDRILIAIIDALLTADPADKALTQGRNIAMQYPQRLATMLKAELPADEYRELENRYRYAMVEQVNVARKREGKSPLDPSPVMLAHPQLNLYVDADSKHPMESSEGKIGIGCTSCHDGSGEETNFVLAAHVARPIWVDTKTGEPVLAQQVTPKTPQPKERFALANMLAAVAPEGSVIPTNVSAMHIEPAVETEFDAKADPLPVATEKTAPTPYIDPVTGKRGQAVAQLRYWMNRYEPDAGRPFELVYHEWDRPMLPPKFIQANCVRCHTEAYDIRDTAPVVYEGRALFTRLGCVNCHQMDSIAAEQNRKVGPDLRHVTAKLSPEFINTWIWAPKAFRPTTKMPHFFMLENNSSDEEIRRTRQETRAITEYLVRTAEPLPPAHVIPASFKGSPAAGQALFDSVGCLGCHNNLNDNRDAHPCRRREAPDHARREMDHAGPGQERQAREGTQIQERQGPHGEGTLD